MAEALRLAEAEAEARRQAAAAEARRQAEAEARRLAEEAEAEARRKAAEAEEDTRRTAAEAEEEGRRQAAEAEALRISVEVAAIRERLARAPVEVEGGKRHPRAAPTTPDSEDTTASDGPYRYLALARREGFEVSEKIERGTPEQPETVWLLYEQESGLRLILVTTDEEVREASLHYNLRTEDDSLLEATPPEHRDLDSRTIYGREACLHQLRARCRRLRATGALERDWKVSPTFQHPVSAR
jgi:colicin import membrane protein